MAKRSSHDKEVLSMRREGKLEQASDSPASGQSILSLVTRPDSTDSGPARCVALAGRAAKRRRNVPESFVR